MRYRKLLLILSIVTLSLTACKKEENLETTEATAIEENTVEAETTDDNAVTVENTEEQIMESETEITDDIEKSSGTSPLHPDNITLNEDGTYSFTDDFLVAVQTINGAAGLTDDRLDIALQNAADAIINMGLDNEQDIISTIETEIAIQEYDQFKEQANQGGGNSSNNSGSQQTQNQGGNTSSGNGEDQVVPGPVDEVGAMDDVIAGLLQEEITITHGAGDGTHVGTGH